MTFDGLVVRAAVHGLKARLEGGRISRIHQPNEADLLLSVRSGGMTHKLLLSANLSLPRFYLTDETFANPKEPPLFTMLLRKHLEGGIIQKIEQTGLERIIRIEIASRNELGDLRRLRLVVELMGRHSNIILLDAENFILDGIHHVTPAISRHRQVLPGRPYVPPPDQGKINPLEAEQTAFLSALSFNEGKLDQQLVQRFQGISPLIAREILHRAGLPTRENLWHAFHQVMQQIKEHRYQPNIVTTREKTFFSVILLTHLEGERETFADVHAMLQRYYQTKAAKDLLWQKAQLILRIVQQEKTKNEKKLKKLEETLEEAKQAEKYRLWGELITAFQFQIKKGDTTVRLPNYYEKGEPLIEIPLDPELSPNENAQNYFKRYNKAKGGLGAIREQIGKTKEEIAYLEQIAVQAEQAEQRDLDEILAELEEQGYIRRGKKKQKKEKEPSPKPERYLSSEGYTIWVGRNNKQNEILTHRMAKPGDTWLHAKNIPGSHVVISGEGYGEKTLHEAAMLAAWFSKGRHSGNVPVDYTLIRHVRKPSGAKPGFVVYDHQKTLYVTPDEEWFKKIPLKERG